MGLGIFRCSSDRPRAATSDCPHRGECVWVRHPSQAQVRAPDLSAFRILRTETVGNYLLAEVQFRDWTNYQGRKLLMYRGLTETELRSRKAIDPHFEELRTAPVARFRPTAEGWGAARLLAGKGTLDLED